MSVLNKNYPTSFGNRRVTVGRVTGPASYVQYVAPTTGGQDYQPFGDGVKDVDFAAGAVTDSGTYEVKVAQIEASTLQGRSLGRTRLVLAWFTLATGAEVAAEVDLSAETVSILVIGGQ